jgi:hypothetical protein
MFALVAFGTVDVSYMLFEWGEANKAAYMGTRFAVVSDPVASGITNLTYNITAGGNQLGSLCFNPSTGADNGNCTTVMVDTVCTPAASNGTCTGWTWNETAFTAILTRMQTVFPRLTRRNIQVSYKSVGLGFVGRPNGLPMDVTVSIQCMTHRFYFLGALMRWIFTVPRGCPSGTVAGIRIPSFATTLPSEDMASNDHPP